MLVILKKCNYAYDVETVIVEYIHTLFINFILILLSVLPLRKTLKDFFEV